MTKRNGQAAPKPKRDNTRATRQPNGKWKPGIPSPNPAGAPKRGESWAEVIKQFGDLTPAEAAAQSLVLAEQLLKIGNGITLKQAVVLRAYATMAFEPDARLLVAMMDRGEGKLSQTIGLDAQIQHTVDIGVRLIDYRSGIAEAPARSALDSPAPGEVEVVDGREALGKDRARRSADVEHAETTR